MKLSSPSFFTIASRLKLVIIAVVAIMLSSCTDNGPPPDETAKNAPPAAPKDPNVKKQGAAVKVKSIKDRS